MKANLMRAGSVPFHHAVAPSQPKISLSRYNSFSEVFSGDKASIGSPKISLQVAAELSPARGIRRVLSDSDVIGSQREAPSRAFSKLGGSRSRTLALRIPEAEEKGMGRNVIPVEERGFSGGGLGKGTSECGDNGDGNDDGGHGDRRKIGDYYRQVLKCDPNNALLLMNYGKFLCEVEKDVERAEEYFGRAILANPEDGEALYLYGKLIWETRRDEETAKSYFDRAVCASPNDCTLMGSYAHFMWEADDDDDEVLEEVASSPAMVSAV